MFLLDIDREVRTQLFLALAYLLIQISVLLCRSTAFLKNAEMFEFWAWFLGLSAGLGGLICAICSRTSWAWLAIGLGVVTYIVISFAKGAYYHHRQTPVQDRW